MMISKQQIVGCLDEMQTWENIQGDTHNVKGSADATRAER
jgi:hypothetical protein